MTSGRPKTYTKKWVESHVDSLPDMFKSGESVAEVCCALDMSKDTFYRLVDEYPVFSDAYKKGLQKSEAWWTKLGRGGAAGAVKINPATWIFNMKNRFHWTDRQETNHGVTDDLADLLDDIAADAK